MKKKIAGIILASVLTFSAMAGVQASAEDRLWENSMEADGVEDDISQNQTEMKAVSYTHLTLPTICSV